MRILPPTTEKYRISGGDFQLLIVNLNYTDRFFSSASALVFLSGQVYFQAKAGDRGFFSSLGSLLKRKIAGESLLWTFYQGRGQVGLADKFFGRIIPIELQDEAILCQKSAFLEALGDIDLSFKILKKLGVGLFGGEGFVFQKIKGSGIVFLTAAGELTALDVPPEGILVENGHLVAVDQNLDIDLETVRGIKNVLWGGEGLFLLRISGQGKVLVQSTTIRNFFEKLQNNPK